MPRKKKDEAAPEAKNTGAISTEKYAYTPFGKAKVVEEFSDKITVEYESDKSRKVFKKSEISIAK